MVRVCSICRDPATQLCFHSNCLKNPFVCQGKCSEQHTHDNIKQFMPVQEVQQYAKALQKNNISSWVLKMKNRVEKVREDLQNFQKRYEYQLGCVSKKLSPFQQKLVNSFLAMDDMKSLKGRDIYDLVNNKTFSDQLPINLQIRDKIKTLFEQSIFSLEMQHISQVTVTDAIKAQYHQELGEKYFSEKKFPEALEQLMIAHKYSLSDAKVIFRISECCLNLNMYEDTHKWVQRCVAKDKKGIFISKSYNNLGDLNLKFKNYSKAIDCYRRSIAVENIKQNQALYLYNRGNAYVAYGDLQLAIEDYTNAILKNPLKEYIERKNQIKQRFEGTNIPVQQSKIQQFNKQIEKY